MNTEVAEPSPTMGSGAHCPSCLGAFRSPTDVPHALIECPHCRTQSRRDALMPIDDMAAAAPRRPSLIPRAAVLAVVLGVGVLCAVGYVLHRLQPATGPAIRDQSRISAGTDTSEIMAPALDAARAVAEQALASPDWRAALASVRDPDRVAPLMETYHARHPWVPLTLTGPHQGTMDTIGPQERATLTAQTERGTPLTLRLYREGESWQLDWEHLVNYHDFAWRSFHENPSESPTPLHVLAQRGSATDAHFLRAGLSPASSLAVRLDGPRPGQPVLAIVPKASDLGRHFQRELTWEHPRPYRCSLRMLDASLSPPAVEITDFSGSAAETP